MCRVIDEGKWSEMPIIFDGPELEFVINRADPENTYEDVGTILRKYYNSSEKQARLLKEWKELRLSTFH